MDKELEKDVEGESSNPADGDKEVDPENPESDKDKNFRALERKRKELEEENERLRIQLEEKKESELNLDPEDGGKESPEKEEGEKSEDPLAIVFKRDVKEAVRVWAKKTPVSSELWRKIKSKVSLKGDETVSEIQDKIQEAYDSLPEVRQAREAEIAKKAKQEAMNMFQDDELDVGSGGDSEFESKKPIQVNSKTKSFAKHVGGLSDKEISEVDESEDPSQWKIHKTPTRKFFQP